MGFDKNDTRPVVNVSKRTTKVNIAMVIAIVLFFIIAGVLVWAFWADPSEATSGIRTD